MTGSTKFAAAAKRNADGFTLLELMTVVAILGILAVMAIPSMSRMLQQQQTKSSATEMAGLLADARARAVSEGTPYLVYFNPPSVDGNGVCGPAAVEVRDVDHSYSITPGDQTLEFHLPAGACNKVTPLGTAGTSEALTSVPMPNDDLAVRAPDASSVGAVSSSRAAVTQAVGSAVAAVAGSGSGSSGSGSGSSSSGSGSSGSGSSGSGSSGSGSSGSGSGSSGEDTGSSEGMSVTAPRSATVAETAVNGATFPVDATSGRPVIAFSERGIPVDPASPNAWGTGAGGVYLTDGDSNVYAALVQPLGDVQLRVFDPASDSWK